MHGMEHTKILTCIRNVPISNPCYDVGYFDRNHPWFPLVLPNKFQLNLNYVTIDLFHILSNLSFISDVPILRSWTRSDIHSVGKHINHYLTIIITTTLNSPAHAIP